jgi:hypothetical protein
MGEELHDGRSKSMSVTEGAARNARQGTERRKPAYVVRAPDPNSRGRWVTLGYAWRRKSGEDGFSLKLNSIPVGNWDGALVLLPPLSNEEVPDQPEA